MNPESTLLTIEDDPAVRSGIRAYLSDSGFRVLEASDGTEGLAVFRQAKPDAVLCDLRLPGMDGLDLLAAIHEESSQVPIIVVSGTDHIGDAVQALKRGAWDYVIKPLPDLAVLERTVRRALERATLLRQNREYQAHLEALTADLREALARMKADEEAGRRTQFQLLPADGWRIQDYTFARRLFPSAILSGDFVDYFPVGDRHVVFYMADVAGHGVGPAFVTVMLKTLMARYREDSQTDEMLLRPDATLARLNRDLRYHHLDSYLTIFYGVLEMDSGRLRCSGGGQYPYPILHEAGQTRMLECRARPVGLFDEVAFPWQELTLGESFALALASDGILELGQGVSAREKTQRLLDAVSRCGGHIDQLAARLGLEHATGLPDDVTLLLLTRGTWA